MTRSARHPAFRGFTLAELIVASVILTVIAGATTAAISQSLRSRDTASAAGEAFSRAQQAVARIAADAQQALRDPNLAFTKIEIITGGPAGRASQGLLLFTHQARNTRSTADAIESDEYEVQYRLEPATASDGETPPANTYTLWRRSDPVPDEYFDAGGVASPVVDGVRSLTIDAYDGASWVATWDSDADGYPHALRIVVAATDSQGRRTVTARRVVAFDRTPPPLVESETEEGTDGSSTTGGSAPAGSTAPTTGGTGTTGGGTGGGGAGRGGTGGTGGTGGRGSGGAPPR